LQEWKMSEKVYVVCKDGGDFTDKLSSRLTYNSTAGRSYSSSHERHMSFVMQPCGRQSEHE